MKESTVRIPPSWHKLLSDEFEKPYFKDLREKIHTAYTEKQIFPHPKYIFRAFDLCELEHLKVVILGQDPYHTPGVADGLAFSSLPTNPVPPSLLNMYKEIEDEFHCHCPRSPDLTHWAEQGVLLLNASLTVESGKANSHADIGWHQFTDSVIEHLSRNCEALVFILWGNYARKKRELVDHGKHLILESPHPSPLSAHKGFFGNGHFIKANEYLRSHGKSPISWC